MFHKLVDNLNLFHEVKYYVSSTSNYKDAKWDLGGFNLFQMGDDTDDDGGVDGHNDSLPL